MLEVSAATPSVLAQPGAVLAAVPAAPSGDGVQIQDFSAVLAGAALAGQAPALQLDAPAPAPAVALPDPAALARPIIKAAAMPGKNDTSGNAPGKNLPSGKLPATRAPAAAEKLPVRSSSKDPVQDDAATADIALANGTPPAAMPAALPIETASQDQQAPTTSYDASTPTTTSQPQADTRPANLGRASAAAPSRTPATSQALPQTATVQAAIAATRPATAISAQSAAAAPVIAPVRTVTPDLAKVTTAIAPANGPARSLPTAPAVTTAETPARAIEVEPAAPAVQDQDLAQDALPATIQIRAALLTSTAPSTVQAILAQQLPALAIAPQPSAPVTATPVTTRSAAETAPVAAEASAPHPGPAVTLVTATAALEPAILIDTPVAAKAVKAPVRALPDDAAKTLATPAPITTGTAKLAASIIAPIVTPDQTLPRAAVQPAPIVQASDHKSVHATSVASEVAADRPVADITPAPFTNEIRTAPAQTASTVTATPTTPTLDIAALVDRITEARAAAAPHTVRAALMHEEFGAISMNFHTEASHIRVTLDNADPGFAPAVQAAAAASLAGNAAQDDASARRDVPVPQTAAQAQDTAARNDAAQQQTPRDRAPMAERHAARQPASRQDRDPTDHSATASTPRRRGGMYA